MHHPMSEHLISPHAQCYQTPPHNTTTSQNPLPKAEKKLQTEGWRFFNDLHRVFLVMNYELCKAAPPDSEMKNKNIDILLRIDATCFL